MYRFEKLGFALGLGFRPTWTGVRRMKLLRPKFWVLLEVPSCTSVSMGLDCGVPSCLFSCIGHSSRAYITQKKKIHTPASEGFQTPRWLPNQSQEFTPQAPFARSLISIISDSTNPRVKNKSNHQNYKQSNGQNSSSSLSYIPHPRFHRTFKPLFCLSHLWRIVK